MVAIVDSVALNGISAIIVNAEVTVSSGLPQLTLIGLADRACAESRERVLMALKNTGIELVLKKIVVNLSPAELRKFGGKFDLAIALAIAAASGFIPEDNMEGILFLGELSLSGRVRRVRGIFPMVLGALKKGYNKFVVPAADRKKLNEITGAEFAYVETLEEAVGQVLSGYQFAQNIPAASGTETRQAINARPLLDIKGQPAAVRAATIAAAGRHHILLYGPPGVGKTMLAKRIPFLLPEMSRSEYLETRALYDIFSWNQKTRAFINNRPFRAPHHSASDISLVGGGSFPLPGEISLAHNGILFLDEFQEFKPSVLNMLRQPLQDKEIHLARAAESTVFPADFMLICAMNPCPCGNYLDRTKICTCSPYQIRKHFSRITGPLLDRIDLQIEMTREGEESQKIVPPDVDRIARSMEKAHYMQQERYHGTSYSSNTQVQAAELDRYMKLQDECQNILERYMKNCSPSKRAIDAVRRVARTIADMRGEGSELIEENDLLEAIQYRSLENRI